MTYLAALAKRAIVKSLQADGDLPLPFAVQEIKLRDRPKSRQPMSLKAVQEMTIPTS
jgi:hypothetical protein